MSKQTVRLPHEIDPFRLVEMRAHLEGEIPLKQFKRLRPLLYVNSGTISVSLDFDTDELKVPCVQGRLKSSLALVCQRCLERYDYEIDLVIKLAWIRSEQVDDVVLQHEPYLVEATPLKLNDVLEDEILLALPNIAMHELSKCAAKQFVNEDGAPVAEIEEEPNPFSVLAKLKSDK